jgi:hypothetical protein
MKNIFIILIILTFFCTSCNEDFINLSPEDQESAASFFHTEEQFRQAVTAAYVPLRDFLNNDFYTGEMRSDNTHYEYYSSNRGSGYVFRELIADFLDQSDNTYINAVYYHCYAGISRANIVITRISGADIDEAAKNNIEGQAKFLRAFNYFKLVRYFGGVPLYIKEVTTANEAFLPRSTAEQVYEQIIADATDAIDKLNPPSGFPQSGEASKGSATMLLAEVYMTLKDYAKAETLLKTLPAMGYELMPDYASVFSPSNKNSKESIFEVQYKKGAQGGQESSFIYRFLPRSKNTTVITGVKTNNVTIGGWNTPTKDIIDTYEAGDQRLDASLGIAEGKYNASNIFTFTANKSIIGYVPEEGKTGVPYIKKYLHPHSLPKNTDDNWPVYRYSDALLLLAETLNEQNRAGEALGYLNPVRNRAGLDDVTTTNQSELRAIIAHERRVELAFENHRWHDLVRTGKAIPVMTAYGNALKQQYNYLSVNSYEVTENRLLFGIPVYEIEINPDLSQNPGY